MTTRPGFRPLREALTIPELLGKLRGAIWGDLITESQRNNSKFTARQPMISSLRRNVQQEYVERLIDLTHPRSGLSIGEKPVQDLASVQLRELVAEIDKVRGSPWPRSRQQSPPRRNSDADHQSFGSRLRGEFGTAWLSVRPDIPVRPTKVDACRQTGMSGLPRKNTLVLTARAPKPRTKSSSRSRE